MKPGLIGSQREPDEEEAQEPTEEETAEAEYGDAEEAEPGYGEEAESEEMADEEAPVGEQQGEQATPEEQQAYKRVMLAAAKILYADDKSSGAVMNQLERQTQAEGPAKACGEIAATLVAAIDDKSGNKTPEAVIFPAAEEILQLIVEAGATAGFFEETDELIEEAVQYMVMAVAKRYDVDPQEMLELMRGRSKEEINAMATEQDAIARRSTGAKQAPQQPPAEPTEGA